MALQFLPALTALTGTAGVVGGIASLFGGKKKTQDVADPLAGIRAQLQSLAAGVPALVARQKQQIGERYGEARAEGVRDIGESVSGERGLGRTSIYDRLKTELTDKLARSQAEAELNAEFGGLTTQANILGGTAGMYPQAQEEEQSFLSKIVGPLAQLGTSYLGNQQLASLFKPDTKQYGYDTSIEETPDWLANIKKSPASVTV